MILRLPLKIVVKWSCASIISTNSILVHVVHWTSIVVVTILVSVHIIAAVHVVSLLVVADHCLHVPDSNTENNIHTILELSLTEDLVLVQHFEITAKSKKTVASCLMLWADSAASDFIT